MNFDDDESLALALAREEDEAFALSLAREQEGANDGAVWGATNFSSGHGSRAAQLPWDLDDTLSAVLAAATTSSGPAPSLLLEDLLGLGPFTMGNTTVHADPPRPCGPSAAQIQRLPTRRVSAETIRERSQDGGDEEECPVCFASYAVGDELRTLPCMHSFHVECIDRWLTSGREGASACPVCHCDVNL